MVFVVLTVGFLQAGEAGGDVLGCWELGSIPGFVVSTLELHEVSP